MRKSAGAARTRHYYRGGVFIMEESKPKDLITASEARSLLRVSRIKMATLLKNGTLRHYANPLDNRVKLVSKAEVLSLIPERAEAA